MKTWREYLFLKRFLGAPLAYSLVSLCVSSNSRSCFLCLRQRKPMSRLTAESVLRNTGSSFKPQPVERQKIRTILTDDSLRQLLRLTGCERHVPTSQSTPTMPKPSRFAPQIFFRGLRCRDFLHSVPKTRIFDRDASAINTNSLFRPQHKNKKREHTLSNVLSFWLPKLGSNQRPCG